MFEEGQVGTDNAWMTVGRCRDHDPDVFFVRGAAQAKRAIRICERCPVREACLQYALDNAIDFGVWGGLTERQRRRMMRVAAASTPTAVAS